MEMIDISSIFSNLIDNAIEVCARGGKLRKGRFITSKKDKFYHEIGIESIKSSINKYGGDIRIKEEEEKFVVSIYLPIYES